MATGIEPAEVSMDTGLIKILTIVRYTMLTQLNIHDPLMAAYRLTQQRLLPTYRRDLLYQEAITG
jgi:hypothetical protein